MEPIVTSKGDQRRRKLLELIRAQGKITIAEAMDAFACSEATARRDIEALEKSGAVIRTLGGAMTGGAGETREASFQEKRDILHREKEAIARKAASLVAEGDIVGLTGGSTTFLIARAMKRLRHITVVTNAVNIAAELADSDDIQIVVTGGVMRKKSFELCGPLAEKTLEDLNLTKMFLGVDGISPERGLTTYSETEARINQLLMSKALKTFAVFDHSKYGKVSLFPVAALADVQGIVTDRYADGEDGRTFVSLGLETHLAEKGGG